MSKTTSTNSTLVASLLMAAILFFASFIIFEKQFWISMTLTAIILSLLSFAFCSDSILKDLAREIRKTKKIIIWGILSAILLYLIFYTGHLIISFMFPVSKQLISNVYVLKEGHSKIIIGLLMFFIIGPGEEIFWRAYIQRELQKRFKGVGVIMSVLAYTLVHLPTLNIMLLMAALFCGLFWGWIYYKYQSLGINIISHALWDVLVFLIIPFSYT